MSLQAYLAEHATIEVIAEQDDIPIRGNAMASGDDDVDRKVEDEILARLDGGDVWAWAAVEVRATLGRYTGSDYLGACSYADEADFRANSGYFDGMRGEALKALTASIEDAQEYLTQLFHEAAL